MLFPIALGISVVLVFLISPASPVNLGPEMSLVLGLSAAGFAAPVLAGPITNLLVGMESWMKGLVFTVVCTAVMAASLELADMYMPAHGSGGWTPTEAPKSVRINPVIPAIIGVGIAWGTISLGGSRGLFLLGLLSLPAAAGFVIRGMAHPQYGDVATAFAGVAALVLLMGLYLGSRSKNK